MQLPLLVKRLRRVCFFSLLEASLRCTSPQTISCSTPARRYIVDYDEVLTRYRVVVHISSTGFVGQVLTDIMEALKKKGERIDEVRASQEVLAYRAEDQG